jgi:hypothetical protein
MSISQKHYRVGFELFIAGQPLTACHSADMRRGWWAALDASADADTSAYLSRGVR